MPTFLKLSVCLLLSFLASCGSLPVNKQPHATGKVLLLPPRDVVQDGSPHQEGVDSGNYLQNSLARSLRAVGYEPMTADGLGFSSTEVATKEQATTAAKQKGADYCLQVVLGEFRDAAPMTFRSDFVTLASAVMWTTDGATEVWKLKKPVVLEKGNIGSYRGLLDDFARRIAKSMR